MPKPKRGYYQNKKSKKSKLSRADEPNEEDEDMDLLMAEGDDDFFDEDEFVPPEGEDLDEFDDTFNDLYAEGDLDELEQTNLNDEDGEDYEGEGEGEGEDFEEQDNNMEQDDNEMDDGPERIIVDNARLSMVVEGVKKKSKKAFRLFLKIFRGIVMQGLSDDTPTKQNRGISYETESGSVYNRIIRFALTEAPRVLKYFIENGGLKAGRTELAKSALILCNVYFANFLKLLQRTHDKNILAFVLTNSILIIKMIAFVPVYLRKFLQLLIGFWAKHESNLVKFKAFVNIKTICEQVKDTNFESIYRKMYLTFIQESKQVNWFRFEQIRFMVNCYVELLGLNKEKAYIVGFSYIRTIALHLKNCMKERTKENIFKIYNWQFLNAIRLWFSAIGAYPDKDDLGRLAHPLIEITFGILKFYPNVKYSPFRLHLIEYLNDFSQKSSLYIPVSSLLLGMLTEVNFNKKRDKSNTKQFDFTINVRVQKQILKSQVFYEQLFKKIVHELVETYSNITNYIAFPESLITTKLYIRKILKTLKVSDLRLELKRFLQLLTENEQEFKISRDRMSLAKNAWEVCPLTREYDLKMLKNLNIVKLGLKIKKDAEEYIKQNVLAEVEKFYAGDADEDENGADENQEEQATEEYME